MEAESTNSVEVTVNGRRQEIPAGASVADLLELLEVSSGRVAVELNREILKKEFWAGATLSGGEELEIVHFVGGG